MKIDQVIRESCTGVLISIDNIVAAVAFSVLIYQGVLSSYIPLVTSLMLIATIIVATNALIQSRIPCAISKLQNESAILYAAMAVLIVQAMPENVNQQALFFTVIFSIGLTTMVTGLLFYLVGKYKLGDIIRYFPYPVISGFLASIAWLIFYGTLQLLLSSSADTGKWSTLFELHTLSLWLPALIAAILIFVLKDCLAYQYAFQLMLALLFVSFFAIVLFSDISLESEGISQYVVGPFIENASMNAMSTDIFNLSYFSLTSSIFYSIFLVILVCFISLLINANSLEILVGETVDINEELRIAGTSNIVVGALGSVVGYLSLSASTLSKKQGAKTRLTGLMAIIPVCLVLFFGINIIGYFPKVVLGASLFYIAITLFYDRLIETWFSLKPYEYLIIIVILITSVTFDMITAVVVGAMISIFQFTFRYSLISPVQRQLSGEIYHSSFERSPALQALLREKGGVIQVFNLQGYLFFGSVYKLCQKIKSLSGAKYIILDFERVNNIDASRIMLMEYLRLMAVNDNLYFVLSSLTPDLHSELLKTKRLVFAPTWLKIISDNESALQYCEQKLISKHPLAEENFDESFEQQLLQLGFSDNLSKALANNAAYNHYQEDETLCHEGEKATSVYFIYRGQVSVLVGKKRMLTVGAGNILGEIAMYTNKRRSATLLVDKVSIIIEVDIATIDNDTIISPDFKAEFHKSIARLLANRLIEQNKRLKLFTENKSC